MDDENRRPRRKTEMATGHMKQFRTQRMQLNRIRQTRSKRSKGKEKFAKQVFGERRYTLDFNEPKPLNPRKITCCEFVIVEKF